MNGGAGKFLEELNMLFWIWCTNMQFRAPGVLKFFEMAYEKLFHVTVC